MNGCGQLAKEGLWIGRDTDVAEGRWESMGEGHEDRILARTAYSLLTALLCFHNVPLHSLWWPLFPCLIYPTKLSWWGPSLGISPFFRDWINSLRPSPRVELTLSWTLPCDFFGGRDILHLFVSHVMSKEPVDVSWIGLNWNGVKLNWQLDSPSQWLLASRMLKWYVDVETVLYLVRVRPEREMTLSCT